MPAARLMLATVAVPAAVVLTGVAPAAAAPCPSRVVVATLHHGVRTIGDLRVGPLGSARAASTLAEVRARWGPERHLQRRSCTAGWGTGVRLLFESFGGERGCAQHFLQVAIVTGPRWEIDVGQRGYRVGMPRRQLPRGAKRIRGWMGGGSRLATIPGIDGLGASVMAHVNRHTDRVDRFVLFIGGAGE